MPPPGLWLGFPCGSAGKQSACNVGDLGWIPGLGRSPGEGKGYPLQYASLENSMNCIVPGVTKSQTRLSHFHFQSYEYMWELAMPTRDYPLDWMGEMRMLSSFTPISLSSHFLWVQRDYFLFCYLIFSNCWSLPHTHQDKILIW